MTNDPSSSKGRTPDFESGNCGSNPCEGAILPWAVVSTSTIQLFDQTIKVHHLNDGRRVIDAEDVEKFWKFLVVAAGAIDRDELKKAMEGLK